MGNGSGFWDVIGLVNSIINNHSTKTTLQRIDKLNAENQGITYYMPSQIEAFFEDSEQLADMAVSGGDLMYRSRAILGAVRSAYIQNYSVIILHVSNQLLEKLIVNYFSINNVSIINSNNPFYDPFLGLSSAEISRLVLASTSKGYEIKGQGKYYIEGITNFIKANKIQPYCNMYITCPHLTLIDDVNEAEKKGVIDRNSAQLIISQIMQGEVERGNIDSFFTEFGNQSRYILTKKSNLNKATNIRNSAQNRRIILLDIVSSTNKLLLNMILNEAEYLVSQGRKVFIVLDNIPIMASDVLQNLEKNSGSKCNLLLSSDDVFASFGGNENSFFSFIGKTSKIVIFRHTSAFSCQKWSDAIGTYEKYEISTTYGQNTNYTGLYGVGSTNTASVSAKRENIVKPEAINRMQTNEVYIISKASGELAYTTIT
ncbi:hypothetical protein [Flexilinea flocculi]|uniref:Uncharacterized protein n=1 Tax=Flexilinea flocculi TaxID=1678840 RepID=A0A0S7BU05_9CHLR|nr:hypothetical protein [Flexilinea flocculi]NMC35179.1 hypothetical protein [Veillonellaceae bacterium]GAP40233.1 hypothetical protein ATC1_13200 [Flexilinea flocculi]